jgi:hypothetical protein
LTKADAQELLRSLDQLCAAENKTSPSSKKRKEKKEADKKPRRRPPLFGEKMVLISFHLPRQMLEMLDDYAVELKTTRSAVIRHAISQMLEQVRKATEEQALLLAQAAP